MSRFHSLLSLGKHACHTHAARLDDALHALLNSPGPESIHDVRVACRRLDTALPIIEPLYQRQNLEPLHRKIKDLLKTLGKARDREVLAERARAIHPPDTNGRKRPATHPAIAGALRFAGLLEAQAELGRMQAAALASHAGVTHLPGQIEKAVHAASLHPEKLKRYPRIRLPEIAAVALREHVSAVRALGITPRSSSDDLHELRIAFKKLRYCAEFFEPGLHARAIQPLIRRAMRYQEILGDLHDADVALEAFREWHAVHPPQKTAQNEAYSSMQAGISKLMHQARKDQARLRAQFFKLWSAAHQRELAELVAAVEA